MLAAVDESNARTPSDLAPLPVFLSVVYVVRNQEASLQAALKEIGDCLSRLAFEYEIVVVDNASTDGTVLRLRELTGETSMPNIQGG